MVTIRQDDFKGNTVLLKPSKFKTIIIDAVNETDPQQKILSTIANSDIEGYVVKIVYSISPDQVPIVNITKIKEKLAKTSFYRVTPVVVQCPSKTSFPEIDSKHYNSPLKALEKYLNTKPELDKASLLSKASMLLEEINASGNNLN